MFSFSGSMTPPSQRETPRIDPTQIVLLQAQSTASTPRTPHDSPDFAASGTSFVSAMTPREDDDAAAPPQPHSRQLNALLSPSYSAPHGFLRPYSLPDDPRLAASSTDENAHPLPGKLKKRSVTYVSQRTVPRESVRELARQAVSQRKISIGDVTFEAPRESNLRESIRRVQVR
ncbi:hypothetical protein PINS_up012780 [Pythium insidiosum]|nr:hypothetical protein PINS_up012780 [Pythium insidiosum]